MKRVFLLLLLITSCMSPEIEKVYYLEIAPFSQYDDYDLILYGMKDNEVICFAEMGKPRDNSTVVLVLESPDILDEIVLCLFSPDSLTLLNKYTLTVDVRQDSYVF